MDRILSQVLDITRAAGLAIMSYYQEAYTITEKSADNPVTDADLAADSLLKERLTQLLPSAGWLSEETADQPERLSSRLAWVVDPLDGTKEFVLGIPEFCVSVGLVDSGRPVIGVIFNPATKELFYAQADKGAYKDNSRIIVSSTDSLAGSRVDASRSERKRGEFEPFEELMTIRTVGSIAYKLARLAAGQADLTWSRGPKNEWDICAGNLLVLEAGGDCVDLDDRPFHFNRVNPKVNGIIASNGLLHRDLIATLAPYRQTARAD